MVSITWGAISFSLGLLVFIGLPFAVQTRRPEYRNWVAQKYWGLAAKGFGRLAILRRKVGGYEIKSVQTDEAKGAGKITLKSPMLGSDKELHFGDPDNRTGRWKQKPMMLVHESVGGVVDLELAEAGHHWREHLRDGKHRVGDKINPYFGVSGENRLANLDDVIPLVTHDSEPRAPSTMEDWTRKRFEKYRDAVGATELLTTFIGFGVGIGGVVLLVYVQERMLNGASPDVSVPLGFAADAMVLLL